MPTRIFSVDYRITENIKGQRSEAIKESKNVGAPNAQAAIDKAKIYAEKPYSFTDDENGGKIKVTRSKFELINVILRAEAEI